MDTTAQTIHDLRRSYFVTLVAIFLLAVAFSAAWWWFATTPVPVPPPLMEFHGVRVTGPSALCAGDTLTYSVDLSVTQPGVYAVDVSVWRVTPPATVIFSEERRFVASEPTDYTLARAWTVPLHHIDPTTNALVDWSPGRYERRHAISTTSRASEPSIIAVPFWIRADCAANP